MVLVLAERTPSAQGTLIRRRVHMRARRDSVGINVSYGNRHEYWWRVRNRGQWISMTAYRCSFGDWGE
jgi:hypothetical protein